MNLPSEAQRLRIYLGEDDRHDGKPLFEAIVLEARRLGLAGATVLRGPMGFGKSSRVHTEKILRLSEDLPVIVEIIDRADRVDAFMPVLDRMMQGGLVTREDVKVIRYSTSTDA